MIDFYASLSEPVPVSVNNLYTTFRGRRVMTREGRDFKAALTSEIARTIALLPWTDAIEAVYGRGGHVRVGITLHLPIRNSAWKPNAYTKKGNRQSPFKKQDALNYGKAIEDAIADATGIDDACHLGTKVEKFDSTMVFIEVAYEVIEA